jgi:hypothetical protein
MKKNEFDPYQKNKKTKQKTKQNKKLKKKKKAKSLVSSLQQLSFTPHVVASQVQKQKNILTKESYINATQSVFGRRPINNTKGLCFFWVAYYCFGWVIHHLPMCLLSTLYRLNEYSIHWESGFLSFNK